MEADGGSAHPDGNLRADETSIARLLAPTSIAVVGAGRLRGTIGNAVLRNLLAGGFIGAVHPVNPNADVVEGLASVPSVTAISGPVDLAVIAVPAPVVESVVHECAAKRVRSLVVITSGFAETGDASGETALVHFARANGMRLVGPNCFGVANTNPRVLMNATFSPIAPIRGRVGVASQSGGVGIDLLARAGRVGIGVSSFVSLGNKADVSTNDMLQYWERDPDTDVVLLYVESFGNPRNFARIARRVATSKPVLVVKSGRSPAGARGAASHTAALTSLDVAVDELFRQAGVVRVDTLAELFDAAALVAHQPLPAGRRVAVVSNGGGPGILAADACAGAGLEVPELSEPLQAELRAVTPSGASLTNPVDLVASAGAPTFEAAIRAILVSGEVDALVAIHVAPLVTDPADVRRAVVEAARAAVSIPVVACFLGGNAPDGPIGGEGGAPTIPSYDFPESAAHALAHAAGLAEWRRAPRGDVPVFADVDIEGARELVAAELRDQPLGGWVRADVAADIVARAGIAVAPTRAAHSVDEAVAAAAVLGYPVALKAGAPELVHKTERGGVALDLDDEDAVRRAYVAMERALGSDMGGALVQPMLAPGVELIVGVTHDRVFGPLVLFGMGGVTAELLRDTTVRLVPVTDVDAAAMVRGLKSSPLLFGYRGAPLVDVGTLEGLLARIGQLADGVPELADLDCNPVIATADGAVVADLKLQLRPAASAQPATAPAGLPARAASNADHVR
ncbi:MAG: acetate--CoA ligase family protein [Acidimicrobiia bacterium]